MVWKGATPPGNELLVEVTRAWSVVPARTRLRPSSIIAYCKVPDCACHHIIISSHRISPRISSHKRVNQRPEPFISHLPSHLAPCACSHLFVLAPRLHSRRGTRAEAGCLFSSPPCPSHIHHLAYLSIPTYPCLGPVCRRLGVTASPHLRPRGPRSSFVN